MQLLLDTANLEQIKQMSEWLCIAGVTTNPTIICREHTDFFRQLLAIREIIGDKQLHVQCVGRTWSEMVTHAEKILHHVDPNIYIKVPATLEGLRAIKELKAMGAHVTSTVIYSPEQAYLSSLADADYVAVYYNKMCNVNMDPVRTIHNIHTIFKNGNSKTKILAASFRNSRQVMEAILAGADTVTLSPQVLEEFWNNPSVSVAVSSFLSDWEHEYKITNQYF